MNSTEEILSKILLPLNSSWQIENVCVEESSNEVYVDLKYSLSYIEADQQRYRIYDHRPLPPLAAFGFVAIQNIYHSQFAALQRFSRLLSYR